MSESVATVVIPYGPDAETALDTLGNIVDYCNEPPDVVILDDCTTDGTYETILSKRCKNLHILRNRRPYK